MPNKSSESLEAWKFVALLFGFPGIDPHDQELRLPQMAEKVLGIGGVILSAEEHVLRTNLPRFDAGSNLAQQLGRALGGVINGKAGS